MEKLALSISLGLMVLALAAPAYAQSNAQGGSIRVRKDQLPDASKVYRSRPQIDIDDTDPEIHDHRPPRQEADSLEINMGAPPSIPGKKTVVNLGNPNSGGGSTVIVGGRNGILASPNEMHQSHISNHPAVSTDGLAPGQMTGIHGPLGQQAMPHPGTSSQRIVNASLNSPKKEQVAKTYSSYATGNGNSQSQITVTTTGTAKLTSPLKNHLLTKPH